MQLIDRVAVVTGAGRGIGRAVALHLAAQGAAVAAVDRDGDAAAATAQTVSEAGRQAMHLAVDVSDVQQIRAAVDRILAAWGVIDILVNCAGIIRITPFLDVTEEEWDQMLDVNLKGTFFFCQTIGRHMAVRGQGSIINVSSVAGRGGRKDAAAYAASKAGVISVTQSAALALAPYQVRVNAICPGVIATPMWEQIDAERAQLEGVAPGEPLRKMGATIPIGRVGRPEDLVDIVAFLASDMAGYITGQAVNVCGGQVMD